MVSIVLDGEVGSTGTVAALAKKDPAAVAVMPGGWSMTWSPSLYCSRQPAAQVVTSKKHTADTTAAAVAPPPSPTTPLLMPLWRCW